MEPVTDLNMVINAFVSIGGEKISDLLSVRRSLTIIIIIIIIIDLVTLLSILPRLSVGLSSAMGRKSTLSHKVKGRVLGMCLLCDTFVIVLLFAPIFRCFRLHLYSLDILGNFS